jgi:MFS family permease
VSTQTQPTDRPTSARSAPTSGGAARGFGSWIKNRELPSYPKPAARYFYLAVVIIASIVLWYQYFIPPSVGWILIAKFHMTYRFFILTIIVGNAAGMVAAVAGQITDRIGRCWVVIIGLGVVALLQLFAVPNAGSKVVYIVAIGFVGLFEGVILVATPALVRDFTPQLGRASAMGFWTLGPVAGLLVATELAAHTMGATSGDWQREFIISGVIGLVLFVIALLFLRELSAQIRDQLMVTQRDRVLVELKAKGFDVAKALAKPWRQMARFDVVISAIAVSVMLVLFYTASGTFPTAFFVTVFDKATHWSSVPQANALAAWMWGADCIGLVVFGILSDLLRVRKPFMIAGAIGMLVFIPVLISHAGHVTSGYYTVVWICSIIFIFQAMAYSTWMASFTETAEAHNPALTATGLSIWGGITRFCVVIMYIFLPFLITSAGTAANNSYRPMTTSEVVAINDIVAGKMPKTSDITATGPLTQIANISPPGSIIANKYPRLVAIVSAHPQAFTKAATYPGTTITTKDPALFTQILGYAHGSIATLDNIAAIGPDLTFMSKYQLYLTRLNTTHSTAPREWQHWLWICFGCTAFFIPFVFVMKGRWSPRRARQDAREHEAFVAAELAKLRGPAAPSAAGDIPAPATG